jgi:hypothetical protein
MTVKRFFLAALLFPAVAFSADAEYELVIKNHQFSPTELKVPKGKKIKLTVINQDDTPEEFESYSLNREKVIAGNAKAIIYIGPLPAGKYKFIGEFHERTAQGVIVAE